MNGKRKTVNFLMKYWTYPYSLNHSFIVSTPIIEISRLFNFLEHGCDLVLVQDEKLILCRI